MPGFSVQKELANLVEAGLTPLEALQTATRNASNWFVHPEGGGVFGAITLGGRADLVLLDADPLADITNVSKIRGVMVQGRWLPKAELQRMLEALPVAFRRQRELGRSNKFTLISKRLTAPRSLSKKRRSMISVFNCWT